MEISNDVIWDIFNIPKDGSNIQDDEDFSPVQSSNETFEDKTKSLNKQMSMIPKGIALVEKVEELEQVISTEVKEIKNESVMAKNSLLASFDDDSDGQIKPKEVKPESKVTTKTIKKTYDFLDGLNTDESEKTETVKPNVKTAIPASVPQLQEEPIQKDIFSEDINVNSSTEIKSNDENTVIENNAKISNRKSLNIGWKLTNPDQKFSEFYKEKREHYENMIGMGGEIPFNDYADELNEAHVDIDVPIFDTEAVGSRITLVQKWRDRIKTIQLHVNSQYFYCKRIYDLLPGLLSRIEYERGKQDGIICEHLSDFNRYFGALDGLLHNCEVVIDNLNSAYASLSRQVAIIQPLQETDRFTPSDVKPYATGAARYDSLTTNANKGASNSTLPKDSDKPQSSIGWNNVGKK